MKIEATRNALIDATIIPMMKLNGPRWTNESPTVIAVKMISAPKVFQIVASGII
jgi:hypothetical protein